MRPRPLVLSDHLAEFYATETGSPWRPRSGWQVNHRALTAAMIDSRDFLSAKRLAETQVLLPLGPRIAFTGSADCNDHQRIWDTLDKARGVLEDMLSEPKLAAANRAYKFLVRTRKAEKVSRG